MKSTALQMTGILLMVTAGMAVCATECVASMGCDVSKGQAPKHVLAQPDAYSPWREYPTQKDIPEIQPGRGESALLWNGREGDTLVRTEEPGQDFSAYSEYCFGKAGELTELKFELRTAWGWGYRE